MRILTSGIFLLGQMTLLSMVLGIALVMGTPLALLLQCHETRTKKAGTRLASSGDDSFQFFELIDGARECTFCM